VGEAAAIYQKLLRHGVIVRPIGNYGMPEWLRVSVGLAGENRIFLETLARVLGRHA
jgi:histidinol-phosphate aminotransferase